MSSYVFIDTRFADINSKFAGLAPDAITVILDPSQAGISQIAAVLAGQSDVASVHIVSHGADGALYLGDTVLTSDNLYHYSSELSTIGAALGSDGDILLYGCNVAATVSGQHFIEQLAAYTQADVAASTDITGASTLGGNWQLEAATGHIDSIALSAPAYAGLLDVFNGDNNPNNLLGSANDDLMTGFGSNDTISGAAGFDRSIYSAGSAGYNFNLSTGNIIVTDTNPGNGDEGADRLTSIEAAQFTDGTITIGSVAEVRVNSATANDQTGPAFDTLSDGGYVIAWESNLQDGSGVGVYAQRYDATGVVQGVEFRVNSVTANDQSGPAIAAFSHGDFVVTWDSDLQDGSALGVYAQRYNVSGVAQGVAFRVNATTASDQDSSSIAALDNDEFVVTWNSLNQDGSGYGIYAQRYNAAGVAQGAEFRVNTTTLNDQAGPEVAALSTGGFIVVWTSGVVGATDVFAQRYNSIGVAQGVEFRVNTTLASDQDSPVVAELANGDFVVTWNSLSQDGSGLGVYAQRLNASGVAQGAEFRVNTATANDQDSPSITSLDDGGFVVTWNSLNQDGSLYGVYGQRFNASGVAQGAEFRVNTTTANDQDSPSIASLDDGGFMVTWESNLQDGSGFGIFAQRYDASANAIAATLSGDAGGNTTDWSGTQSVIVDGGVGDDMLSGGSSKDTLNGGLGADTADYTTATGGVLAELWRSLASNDGQGGSDTLISIENLTGSGFNDVLAGDDNNNVFKGGAGVDAMYGGGGIDTADYSDATGGMRAELWQFFASNDGQGGADTLVDIENLTGSAFADTLAGDDNDNEFKGAAGNDAIFGGGGSDTADYSEAAGGVFAELWRLSASNDGQGGADVLVDIENLTGSAFTDTFAGDNNDNLFIGGAGNDALFGGGGTDTADYSGAGSGVFVELWKFFTSNDGQGGADTLVDIENITGSAFNDTIAGDDNNNVFKGGAGVDAAFGGGGMDSADYSDAGSGVFVELWRFFTSNDGQGGADTLVDIENVSGSAFNDTVAGDNNNNVFKGGAGVDAIFGGGGTDTADYSSASNGVHVELWQFFANSDGQGGADTLVDMENVTGSAFADVLAGDNNANRLEGAGGTDVLYGGGGADSYAYGGGSGVDYIGDFIKAQGDKIHLQSNLNGSGITTGAQALAATVDVAGNAVVDLGGGNSVTLVGVAAATLAASDFLIF